MHLLEGGNIGLCTTKVQSINSEMRPGENLVAFMLQCLSKDWLLVHNMYVVFENMEDEEYVPPPCSDCGHKNGAFFCSHMLCFTYITRIVQRAITMGQEAFENVMPVARRLLQYIPCLIENILAKDIILGGRRHKLKGNPKIQENIINVSNFGFGHCEQSLFQ